MATATLLYRVDAGPLLSVSSTLAGGETISLTAASFAGWAASAALWEILDYPPGWPAPVGWSTDSINGRYYYRASTGPSGVTPPDFTIPVPGPIWGKWLFRLTVNGAIFSAVLGVKTRSPTIDLDDLAYGESSQWGGAKQWPSDQKDNARKIDAAALAAGQVVAGAGLTKTGNTLDVVAADASITVNANSIEASGDFVAKAITTTSSVTAGASGLIAPKWDRASAGALTLGGTNATSIACSGLGLTGVASVANAAGALALTSGAGNASLDSDAGSKTVVGATSTQVEIGAAAVLTVAGSLVTSGKRVEAPRFTAAPSTPASAGAAVTFNLSTSQNVKHSTTEATTVTFSNAVEGMAGYIEFIQGGTGYTVTMPTNGVGVEYSNAIAALTTTGIVDATANTRTMLRYYVTGSPAVRVVIDVRAVSTIP